MSNVLKFASINAKTAVLKAIKRNLSLKEISQIYVQSAAVIKLLKVLPKEIPATLLMKSMTNHTFSSLNPDFKSMERLEFLGDAVIEIIVTEHLFENYQDMDEGQLTKFRASLVNNKKLSKLARAIKINKCILSTVPQNLSADKNLSDALEALVGAYYLTYGLIGAKELLHNMFSAYKEKYNEDFMCPTSMDHFDYVTKLIEWARENKIPLPKYKYSTKKDGKHTVSLYIQGELVGRVSSQAKKDAKSDISKIAYLKLQNKGKAA
jgi:ribonuclease III